MCGPAAVPIMQGVAAALAVGGAIYQTNQTNKAVAKAAQTQQDQINDAAAEKTNERLQQARALRSQLRAAQAGAGLSGNSFGILDNDVMAQAGQDVALIEKNRQNGIDASVSEAQSRLSSAQAQEISSIGGTLINYGASYAKYRIDSASAGSTAGIGQVQRERIPLTY